MKLTVQGVDKFDNSKVHQISFDVPNKTFTSEFSVKLGDFLDHKQTWELAEWIVEKCNLEIDVDRTIFYTVQEKMSAKQFHVDIASTENEIRLLPEHLYIGI